MAEMEEMVETASEDEDDSFRGRSTNWMPKLKPGKKLIVSQSKMVHVDRALLINKDKDCSMSLWMERGKEHFLLCTLSSGILGGECQSFNFTAKICEPVPVILYVKGHGRGTVNLFGSEKLKA